MLLHFLRIFSMKLAMMLTQLVVRSVTDANLFLGRIQPDFFPKIFGPTEDMPLDFEITKTKFEELTKQINADTGGNKTPEEVASGCVSFLTIV